MNEPIARGTTRGVHHIGLTVPDVGRTRDFFIEMLGYKQVGEVADYPAIFVTDGKTMITLWQTIDPDAVIAFDRRNNVGLHHLALTVDSDDLAGLHERLIEVADVAVEFGPEPLKGLPLRHMMCTIPGGIRVEFIASDNRELE
ncbi:VOC family protein [Lentisalinibacter salinarum]|uniref:VOC family protein n=1 Tax=Lentisalinibacter salinarum TaxID=2992239 RepID=UPI00386FC861